TSDSGRTICRADAGHDSGQPVGPTRAHPARLAVAPSADLERSSEMRGKTRPASLASRLLPPRVCGRDAVAARDFQFVRHHRKLRKLPCGLTEMFEDVTMADLIRLPGDVDDSDADSRARAVARPGASGRRHGGHGAAAPARILRGSA